MTLPSVGVRPTEPNVYPLYDMPQHRIRSRDLKMLQGGQKSLLKPYQIVYVCFNSIAGIQWQQYRRGYLWNYSDCMRPRDLRASATRRSSNGFTRARSNR